MVKAMSNIMVLGSGGFGISLSVMLHKYGNNVCMWSPFQQEIDDIRLHGESRKKLPGIAVDMSIELTASLENAGNFEVIIFATPSSAIRETAVKLKPYVKASTILVNVAKGFEVATSLRLSEVIQSELPDNDVVVLTGPSHAEEIVRGVPTTIVAACKNRESAQFMQDLMLDTNLRVYVNDDLIGVELGGALKNIIAVCAGVCDGMGLGDNTKAALITRGLAEIARLGKAMGAHAETFTGLAGMGDLIVTCTSMHSRNRRCGIFIGQGLTAEQAIARVGMTVEGCIATKAAKALSERYGVDMPITCEIYNVIYNGKDPKLALSDLMGRPQRHESERMWELMNK